MATRNNLDRTFGPFGSSLGFFLMIGGAIAAWFSLSGIILVVIGAFAAFTTTTCRIDPVNKKIKYSDDLFGFIQTGKWIEIVPGMSLGVRKFHRGFVTYINANQPMAIHERDLRIVLFVPGVKKPVQLKKIENTESINSEIKELSNLLAIPFN
jgi:hypothetical protein